jgi:hypothetical protein
MRDDDDGIYVVHLGDEAEWTDDDIVNDAYDTGYHDGHRDAQKEAIHQLWVDHAMMEYEIPLEPRVLH